MVVTVRQMKVDYKFQIHKYRSGHQIVSSTIDLERHDQDTIDRLSDISGQIRPGEKFAPYFTCYPLPSEKYFVVARSWQDLKAPRTGCVVTKSLVIDIEEWKKSDYVTNYFYCLLRGIEGEGILSEPIIEREITEPVFASNVNELVEALFLEQRKPVVVFNSQETDKIAVRLYSILWPGIRSIFACCTFALSPRTVSSRPFDLLFSPGEIKARFSEWDGRRIEGSITTKPARHRWTNDLVYKIFRAPTATLFDTDTSSLFHLDVAGDDNGLRLSLLWNELLAKVQDESSPMAILGLLDIVNSQPIFADNLYNNLRPYIEKAIVAAIYKLTPEDAWKFYISLLAKHEKKLLGRVKLDALRKSCAQLATKDYITAIKFIENLKPLNGKIPSVIFAGIGDGLAKVLSTYEAYYFNWESMTKLLSIVAASSDFSAVLMGLQDGEHDDSFVLPLVNAIETADDRLSTRAISKLSTGVSTFTAPVLVSKMLEKSEQKLFRKILRYIDKNTSFSTRDFDEAILSATRRLDEFDLLNQLALKNGTIDLLVKVVQEKPDILINTLLSKELSDQDKAIVLKDLIYVSYNSYNAVIANRQASEIILNMMRQSNVFSAPQFVRFLFAANLKIIDTLSLLVDIPISNIVNIEKGMLYSYLNRAFNDTFKNEQLLSRFLSKFDVFDKDQLLDVALYSVRDRQKCVENVLVLLNSGPAVDRALIENIDEVSDVIASIIGPRLNQIIADKWAYLLRRSPSSKKQQTAAAVMLDFSFKNRSFDPTTLLAIAFPIIYKTLANDKHKTLNFPFWFFPDWDKCKKMRVDLVHLYFNSNWSRLGLFIVAAYTGITHEVMDILMDMKGGRLFVKDAINEAQHGGLPPSHPLFRDVNNFFDSL